MKKIILTELTHNDAPLAVGELTNYGESLQKVPWTSDVFPFQPYSVFERKNGTLFYLYDERGVVWKEERAGKFDEKQMIEQFISGYKKVVPFIELEQALSLEDLKKLVTLSKEFWTWFDGIWWMIEYRDKNKLDVTELLKARKASEYFTPNLAATLRSTFKHLVPEYAQYADVLLIEEVLGNSLPSEQILKERIKECVYTEGKLFSSMKQVQDIYNVEIKEESQPLDTEILKGQTAYPGKVKGEVKIIKARDDMKKFKEGNIIVSPTTTPDFLPIIKMSSAIISEHGGVICHASITSRELKIPCVVGVKGATKILKDGDMIEVDAEKGIVRILK